MLVLIVDTNLFHEFKPLRDLPWDELGEPDSIQLLACDPVQTELDEHKKSPKARIRRRALQWTKLFRDMTLSEREEETIRAENPTVTLKLEDTPPDTNQVPLLDPSVVDDQLVAIAHAVKRAGDGARTCVFSDDLRPLRKSKQTGMEALAIPDSWRREPEKTEEDRELDRLQAELKRMRQQEPVLTLTTSAEMPLELIVPVYPPLSDDQTGQLMHMLETRHPMETNFERQRNHALTGAASIAGLLEHHFVPASQQAIDQYVNGDYPDWLERCRSDLSRAHEVLNAQPNEFSLLVALANTGTRPADHVLMSITASGPVRVLPDEGQEAEPFAEAPRFELPEPPESPQGRWSSVDALHDMLRGISSPYRNPDFHEELMQPFLSQSLHQPPSDPNVFYYAPRPFEPTNAYRLTCEQFRHMGAAEEFRIRVFPDRDRDNLDGTNALVKVVCEAANLTNPQSLSLPIHLKCEKRSTFDCIKECLQPSFSQLLGKLG